jgi:type I restriction enzyme, S subunit
MTATLTLKSITTETKDGEWGEGQPFECSIKMSVIRGTDFAVVRTGGFSHLPIRYIPDNIARRKTLRPYDILIETAGGSKDRPTGRTLLIKPSLIAKAESPLTCASFARFIRIDQSKADPVYVFWLLQHLYEAGYIRQYHTQHTGVARFQFTTFAEREPLHLPPKSVQCQIAVILSAYDDLIENNTRRIKILEEMAQMIYREWFVDFRFPGHEKVGTMKSEMGSIPQGWQVARVQDFGDLITGKTPSKQKAEFFGTEIPFIKLPDMHGKIFVLDTAEHLSVLGQENQATKTIPPGTLCVSCIGTAGIVIITTCPSQTNQQINSVVLRSVSDREFLYFRFLDLRETINSCGNSPETGRS